VGTMTQAVKGCRADHLVTWECFAPFREVQI